jgi:hypothetical protein
LHRRVRTPLPTRTSSSSCVGNIQIPEFVRAIVGSWRIWPGDIPTTLQWLPTTEIDVADIEDEICSHALVDRSNGSRVRVISASTYWPAAAVRRCLRAG